jgi:hypothetical protein
MPKEPQGQKTRPPIANSQLLVWCVMLGLVFGSLEGRLLYLHGASHAMAGVILGCLIGIVAFFVIRHRRNRHDA